MKLFLLFLKLVLRSDGRSVTRQTVPFSETWTEKYGAQYDLSFESFTGPLAFAPPPLRPPSRRYASRLRHRAALDALYRRDIPTGPAPCAHGNPKLVAAALAIA